MHLKGVRPWQRPRTGSRPHALRAEDAELTAEMRSLLVKTIQVVEKVTLDIEKRFHFNTALAAIMELNNEITSNRSRGDGGLESTPEGRRVLAEAVEKMVRLLEPFAPHIGA